MSCWGRPRKARAAALAEIGLATKDSEILFPTTLHFCFLVSAFCFGAAAPAFAAFATAPLSSVP